MRKRTFSLVIALIVGIACVYVIAESAGWLRRSESTVQPSSQPEPNPFELTRDTGWLPGADITAASKPSGDSVQRIVDALAADARANRSLSVLVQDLADGTDYGALNPDMAQVPASTTKVLTTFAALSELGADHQFETHLRWDDSSSLLVVVPGGDMLLAEGRGHQGASDSPRGYAGVGDLVDLAMTALPPATSATTEITIAYDNGVFEGPLYPASWPTYAAQQGYAGPVTGLAIDAGKVESTDGYAQHYEDPAMRVVEVFSAQLEAAGYSVTLLGAVPAGERLPAEAVDLGAVESAPLWQIARYALSLSENTISENLARMLAVEAGQSGSAENGARAVSAALQHAGVNTQGLVLEDGAGYSSNNRISARQLVDVISIAFHSEDLQDFVTWMPFAGLEGTVAERYAGGEVAGRMFAKTGSLTGVTTLTGIVQTSDGRFMVYAILADEMPAGQGPPRTAIDEMILALVRIKST